MNENPWAEVKPHEIEIEMLQTYGRLLQRPSLNAYELKKLAELNEKISSQVLVYSKIYLASVQDVMGYSSEDRSVIQEHLAGYRLGLDGVAPLNFVDPWGVLTIHPDVGSLERGKNRRLVRTALGEDSEVVDDPAYTADHKIDMASTPGKSYGYLTALGRQVARHLCEADGPCVWFTMRAEAEKAAREAFERSRADTEKLAGKLAAEPEAALPSSGRRRLGAFHIQTAEA